MSISAVDLKRAWYRNPIFSRELLTFLRARKAFALMAVYVVLSAAVVLLAWPREEAGAIHQGQISREVFSLFGLAQTFLLALLIPATLGASMTTEKEGETIDLLLTTPVSPDQILFGKLFSGLAYFVLLAAVSFPVLMLCMVIGGLSTLDVVGLYVAYFFQVLVFGLTSLIFSIYFHRTHVAVILAYVVVSVEALIVQAIYGDGIGFLGGRVWGMLIPGTPIVLMLYVIARTRVRTPYQRVQKTMEEEDTTQQVGLILRRDRLPDRWIVPPERQDVLPDGANPLIDKELQSGIYGAGSLFVRLVIQFGTALSVVAMLGTLIALVKAGTDAHAHPEYIFMCFLIGYVVVLAPSLAARMFTNEKEEKTLEALALTLLPRFQIIIGKFTAILRVVLGLTALNSICFVIVVVFSSFNLSQLAALAIVALSTAVFSTALGLYLSLVCRTTLAAMTATYFTLLGLYVAPVLAETFLMRLIPTLSESSFEWLAFVSPFLACRLTPDGPGFQMMILIVHGAFSLVAAFVLMALGAARFEATLRAQAVER